uniref:Transporter n=1 Tax=Heterorhabditis bacteriophora TaxID=37862 RepID=A0A1I7WFS0_HETBA
MSQLQHNNFAGIQICRPVHFVLPINSLIYTWRSQSYIVGLTARYNYFNFQTGTERSSDSCPATIRGKRSTDENENDLDVFSQHMTVFDIDEPIILIYLLIMYFTNCGRLSYSLFRFDILIKQLNLNKSFKLLPNGLNTTSYNKYIIHFYSVLSHICTYPFNFLIESKENNSLYDIKLQRKEIQTHYITDPSVLIFGRCIKGITAVTSLFTLKIIFCNFYYIIYKVRVLVHGVDVIVFSHVLMVRLVLRHLGSLHCSSVDQSHRTENLLHKKPKNKQRVISFSNTIHCNRNYFSLFNNHNLLRRNFRKKNKISLEIYTHYQKFLGRFSMKIYSRVKATTTVLHVEFLTWLLGKQLMIFMNILMFPRCDSMRLMDIMEIPIRAKVMDDIIMNIAKRFKDKQKLNISSFLIIGTISMLEHNTLISDRTGKEEEIFMLPVWICFSITFGWSSVLIYYFIIKICKTLNLFKSDEFNKHF